MTQAEFGAAQFAAGYAQGNADKVDLLRHLAHLCGACERFAPQVDTSEARSLLGRLDAYVNPALTQTSMAEAR
jgi:hypothetical protein